MSKKLVIINGSAIYILSLIACVLALLATKFLAGIFLPIAAILAFIALLFSIKAKSKLMLAINAFAWALIIIAMILSLFS